MNLSTISNPPPELLRPLIEAERKRREALRKPPPTLADFVHATCQFKLDPWQSDYLCPRLERLCAEMGQRVLIHAPPQWGKSFVISQRFPAYYLGRNPTGRVKVACYNITHATRFGKVCRGMTQIAEFKSKFPRTIVPAQQSAGEWSTAERTALNDGQPSFAALGLATGFIGQGADLLIIDDPYASPQDAASETIRESVWTFWDEAARVRLTEQANVVVMFHRYHEDDLAGRLIETDGLKRNGGKWELLRFAAIADGHGDDPMGRAVGKRLSPRMSDQYLADQQASGFAWDGQFQGLPGRKGGNMFQVDKLEFVAASPVQGSRCRGWDQASLQGAGDFTAGTRINKAPDGLYYIEDVVRGQWDTAARNRIICQTAELDGVACKIVGEQEGGSGGKDQARHFIKMLAGYAVQVAPASGTKEVRADPLSAQVNAGNVRIVRGTWNKVFIDELRQFPLGKNDDQCIPAGVPITTQRGPVPIEAVCIGDQVLTREGYKPVLWSGETISAIDTINITFNNSTSLECTHSHPVWVVGRGWIAAKDLQSGDGVITCDQWLKQWNGMASHGGDTRNRNGVAIGCTFNDTLSPAHPYTSTEKSGGHCTGTYRRDTTYTTRTKTRSTMTSTTSNVLPSLNIASGMQVSVANDSGSICNAFVQRLSSGTGQQRGVHGTLNMQGKCWRQGRDIILPASSVVGASSRCTVPQCTAQLPAPTDHDLSSRSTHAPVSGVGMRSCLQKVNNGFAVTHVVDVRAGRQGAPVFNLTVKDVPEFFANGVLVHNCDSASIAFNRLARTIKVSGV